MSELKKRAASESRITVDEIMRDLNLGRLSVYALLEQNHIPSIRLAGRWIIIRPAYAEWKARAGAKPLPFPVGTDKPS